VYGNASQLADQVLAVIAVPAYAFGATFILLKVIGLAIPLRASDSDESAGLDVSLHGEEAYLHEG